MLKKQTIKTTYLKEYDINPLLNDKNVDAVANCITVVPCTVANDLTENQLKAF